MPKPEIGKTYCLNDGRPCRVIATDAKTQLAAIGIPAPVIVLVSNRNDIETTLCLEADGSRRDAPQLGIDWSTDWVRLSDVQAVIEKFEGAYPFIFRNINEDLLQIEKEKR